MFPVGGVGAMLVGAVLSGVLAALLALTLRRRFGTTWAVTVALLVWSVVCIGLLTLLPANGPVQVVFAEDRLPGCSFDYGGPAPDGFWIFSGGQRMLNTVIFVPSGALLVLTLARWRTAWVTVPIGLVLLAAYSVGIELTQLELARLDRACDVTDMVDNTTGALIGGIVGLALLPVVRPWRHGRRSRTHP
ncbi:VanZ family protein [Nocardioides acrostichi]|uniref:VanZ family protein n=1 Tax=Nocardioides acrostichi TaxID=2784339 RepID=A0A930Y6Q1_9ACTN|nr:VanZ family protein [Nocardioides acrostichi]MBF4161181.1 VanZ family protein [Nocardioides acrostichi]